MFIPRGKVIHENLATSYVLVDALVADLCEGGFSGVVELVLLDLDGFIIIAGGNPAAVLEQRSETYTKATIPELVEHCRQQRGLVSVRAYSRETAESLVGRINGQTLYEALSTEFTDLEKMIWKLAREREREWFVEINTDSGVSALIHMRDTQCRIVSSSEDGEEESDSLDLVGNQSLSKLVYECNRVGGTFDVYFRRVPEAAEIPADHTYSESSQASRPMENTASINEGQKNAEAVELCPNELFVSDQEDERLVSAAPAQSEPGPELQIEDSFILRAAASANTFIAPSKVTPSHAGDSSTPSPAEELSEPDDPDFLLEALSEADGPDSLIDRRDVKTMGDAETMAELKRLMGEIALTIEEAAQAVDRHDAFSMCLRASQLKIADQYPFLDPFGGEFEYLAGEIVFVGQASIEEFTAGFAEALKLSVNAVSQSSGYAEKFRAWITEDLQKLLARNKSEFEKFGLDYVIDEIIRF